jgi:ubiquinone/menaquinone biosynthesis C-methylase UbiE
MNLTNFKTWEEAVSWLIAQPDKQDIVRECYYDFPLIAAADRYWQSEEWQSIRSYLPTKVGQALDIGAGRGISSYALARDGWQVTALEPDASDLVGVGSIQKLATEEHLPIQVIQEFGENLPFPDSSFDIVFARQVLHHARDLPQLCREISRVLKPGGKLIAVRDHVIAKKSDLQKFLDSHPLHNLYGGENAYLLTEYQDALRSAPLTIQKVLGSFDTPIHYDFHSQSTIKDKIKNRFGNVPIVNILLSVILSEPVFPLSLKLFSKIDFRPGRAVSFICYKPEER